MYLKSLEIYGFKSFPEKTSLRFEPGITVVVGPNGCGKSNIFDSIKWALGEQSPKSLRGSKMEDIIFNGTQNHPSLSYSEVTLTFCNDDNYLPIDYKEVSVTRKLYRSGESEYCLNKNPVRLKDIQNLFMGTGVGESTYSFIEQGKIEIFLGYKPEEKRLIFDEASGIIKYKERKKETLRKLNDTEQNLLRLDDIIIEVKRQINYLERQVKRARQYKEIQEKLIIVEKKIATLETRLTEEKENALNQSLLRLKEEEKSLNSELSALKNQLEELNSELRDNRNSLEEISANVISLNSKTELCQNTKDINSQRIEELTKRIKNSEEEISRLKDKFSSQDNKIKLEQDKISSLDGDISSLENEIGRLWHNREEKTGEMEKLNKLIEENKKRVLSEEIEKSKINNHTIQLDADIKSLYSRKKRLIIDREKINEFFREKKIVLSGIDGEINQLRETFEEIKQKEQVLKNTLNEQAAAKKLLTESKIEKEKVLIELTSNYEFLKDLRIKYGGFPIKRKVKIYFEKNPVNINKLVVSLKDVDFVQSINEGEASYSAEVEAQAVLFDEDELTEKIGTYRRDIKDLENEFILKEEEEKETNKLLQDITARTYELDKKLGEKSREQEDIKKEFIRVEEENQMLDDELNLVLDQIKDYEGEKDSLYGQMAEKESDITRLKDSLHENQRLLQQCFEDIKETELSVTKKQAEKTSFENEKNSVAERIKIFEEEKVNILQTREKLSLEIQESSGMISAREEENSALGQKMSEMKSIIEIVTRDKDSLKEKETALLDKINKASSLINEREEELNKIRDDIHGNQLNRQEINFEKTKITNYFKQLYGLDFEPFPVEEGDLLEELKPSRELFQKKIKSLGEVNLVAIEEFEELNNRYTFLNEQKTDLLTSSEELKKAIQKINRTSRQVFMETFTKIREEFKKNFRFLFGGGRAELILIDENNVLESGVEIEVQPPGKKLQNVSLLSGGEKALTATALIFSIFKVRPSPLCVLDEIDAPLDELNVDRFNHILKEFSRVSQFILITHNKKTMSNADVLYGVTMQERGVSKIVSVKFAQENLV